MHPSIGFALTETQIDKAKPNIAIAAKVLYTGDASVNKAIPHGLGVVPKLVLINYNQFDAGIIEDGNTNEYNVAQGYTVTPADATNFYVGNSTDYNASFNHNLGTYTALVVA